ncbi:hypothetical protein [Streptomyces guryensis]|uniref:Uncharacterized protein n=1 Tax=Streptomyces guryensis TaxID=2886947 RepID=A0A9Q3VT94_9ACTN|nr:hypothetical protein [Streptomyces guryensis]MCD9878026.1 hypothetical protein [Streptomyces guryensis]
MPTLFDRCQCPHWGQAVAGKIVFRYTDHDEVLHAGDACYGAPGHLPLIFAGTEIVEFSPTAEPNRTMEVVGRIVAGAQSWPPTPAPV